MCGEERKKFKEEGKEIKTKTSENQYFVNTKYIINFIWHMN